MLIYKNNELSCISWEHRRNKQQVVSLLRSPQLCHILQNGILTYATREKPELDPTRTVSRLSGPTGLLPPHLAPFAPHCSVLPAWRGFDWAMSLLGEKIILIHLYYTGAVLCWAVGWDHFKFLSNKSCVPTLHLCFYTAYYHDCLEKYFLSKDTELLLLWSPKKEIDTPLNFP